MYAEPISKVESSTDQNHPKFKISRQSGTQKDSFRDLNHTTLEVDERRIKTANCEGTSNEQHKSK